MGSCHLVDHTRLVGLWRGQRAAFFVRFLLCRDPALGAAWAVQSASLAAAQKKARVGGRQAGGKPVRAARHSSNSHCRQLRGARNQNSPSKNGFFFERGLTSANRVRIGPIMRRDRLRSPPGLLRWDAAHGSRLLHRRGAMRYRAIECSARALPLVWPRRGLRAGRGAVQMRPITPAGRPEDGPKGFRCALCS